MNINQIEFKSMTTKKCLYLYILNWKVKKFLAHVTISFFKSSLQTFFLHLKLKLHWIRNVKRKVFSPSLLTNWSYFIWECFLIKSQMFARERWRVKSKSETKWLKLIKIEFIKKKDRNVSALDSRFSVAASLFFLSIQHCHLQTQSHMAHVRG